MSREPAITLVGGLRLAQSLWCLKRGLDRAGASVVYIPAVERTPEGKQPVPDLVAQVAASPNRDALLWWQPQNVTDRGVFRAVRCAFDGPMAMQSLDDPFVLDRARPEHWRVFDVAVTCCAGSVAWYEERGVRALVGYPPVDRDLHGGAEPEAAYACDFSFVATNVYPPHRFPHVVASRGEIVRAVADLGELHVYGTLGRKAHDWGCPWGLAGELPGAFRGWVQYGRQPGLYAATRVNLCNHVRPDARGYLNERVTTCLASGGFLLCDRVPGIGEVFEEDREIVLWSTLAELREKAREWLADPERRASVARAGRRKALDLFDNERLARNVLAACGIDAPTAGHSH